MICRIRPLYEVPKNTLRRVLALTRDKSVFQNRLLEILDVGWEASEEDGFIATVVEDGELLGWARTEQWIEHGPLGVEHWDTLEAFVHPDFRGTGVATFAASGLATHTLNRWGSSVATFSPEMMLLAKKVGLHPTLFHKVAGEWVRA